MPSVAGPVIRSLSRAWGCAMVATEQQVHELPPMHVTTVGIPPDEHISAHEAHRRERELWRGSDRVAEIALGLLLLLLALMVVALLAPPPTSSGPGSVAGAQYRADERTSTAATPTPSLASPFTGQAYAALPQF